MRRTYVPYLCIAAARAPIGLTGALGTLSLLSETTAVFAEYDAATELYR